MEQYYQLLSLLTSPSSRFFSTWDEYAALLLSLFPVDANRASFFFERPTYDAETKKEVEKIQRLAQAKSINITSDFSATDIEANSIAYHRIKGLILAESRYYFSTKQFEQDLLASDANPNINIHFLHINSGGGEAWYLDKISETLSGLSKPVYVLSEKLFASAAYYIGVHGDVIKSLTQNDTIGSIGTMVSFLDILPYFEKLGIKDITEYATKSDLKNKKFEDLRNGKPEQFIKEELDPLQQQFESEVRQSRPKLNDLPDDDPIFRGESFSASVSVSNFLIDGLISFPDALSEAYDMGVSWANKQRALSYI